MSRSDKKTLGKVAFFTDTYKPNVDGVVKSITLLEKYLSKLGVNINIFAPSKTLKTIAKENEVLFASIPFIPYKDYSIALPRKKLILSKGPFDVVHNHGIALTALYSLSTAEEFGSKKISTFHTDVTKATHYISAIKSEKDPLKIAVKKYLKWLYKKFDVITTPSQFAANKLKEIGINPLIIPNGIEINKYKKIKRRPAQNILLHLGRVVKEKNLELILEMVKDTNYQLLVVGKGPALNYYKKTAKKMKLENVFFTGFLPDEILFMIFEKVTAMVFASTFDTQGVVVAEALAAGVPVVCYRETAGAEVVREFGTVFSNREEFLQSIEIAKNLKVQELKEKAKEFDIKKIAEKWIDIYEL